MEKRVSTNQFLEIVSKIGKKWISTGYPSYSIKSFILKKERTTDGQMHRRDVGNSILVVLLPSLGSAQFGSVLARAFGQKSRLSSLSFSKSSGLKNFANTSFLKNFEKDHWQSTVLIGKFQFFLFTMAPEGHFQPKDWSKMLRICQKWLKSRLYYVFCNAC